MQTVIFVESEWRDQCERMYNDAVSRCGLVDFLFTQFFSESTDGALCSIPQENRMVALEIAREFGYETPDERARQSEENAEQGLCSHGLDPDCCPLGCGDLDCFNEEDGE